MGYLSTDRAQARRADPRLILPECRSILVLGVRYPALGSPERANVQPTHGRIAGYAWGSDYHDILPERLHKLVDFLETGVGHSIPNRWYTDTGPILEREFAQRAGLGWIGKNTCLIHPSHGSYFLLAEILLGIDLEPDIPHASDHCGSCTRCLDACPTACILPDRTIDARRCISYLTIELKGPIPVELRPEMENWVFGCDVCQEVCPWNQRFASPGSDPAFAPRPDVPSPDLRNELHLSPEEFNRKFKGSPVKRSKRRGYLRNITVAVGNSGDPAAVPDLIRVLGQEFEPLARGHAAWALGNVGGDAAHTALRDAARIEQDPYVLEEITGALVHIQASSADQLPLR
jgi:epoxyqueuosine reductase